MLKLESLLLYYTYSKCISSRDYNKKIFSKKDKHNGSCKARNSLLFVDITKPQSLTIYKNSCTAWCIQSGLHNYTWCMYYLDSANCDSSLIL